MKLHCLNYILEQKNNLFEKQFNLNRFKGLLLNFDVL